MSNRSTYRKLAKKHGVKPKEIKAEMQTALNMAYADPGNSVIQAYQNRVPRKGDTPTVDEFLRYATQKVKNESKDK